MRDIERKCDTTNEKVQELLELAKQLYRHKSGKTKESSTAFMQYLHRPG